MILLTRGNIKTHAPFFCQITQDVGSVLQLLLPLTQEVSSAGRPEVTEQQEDLQVMLRQLKGVAQTLAQAHSPQVREQNR